MKLIGEAVEHKEFGRGKIIEQEKDSVLVLFEGEAGEKKFVYPSAFRTFIRLEDKVLSRKINEEKDELNQKEAEKKMAEVERIIQAAIEKANERNAKRSPGYDAERSNIAFKCNYCDGGKNDGVVGFKGACSDKNIKYNIHIAKHVWCRGEDSDCRKYLDGQMTRAALDEASSGDGYVCYESQMLRMWRAYAGIIQNGGKKGTPKTFRNVRSNSLAVLTTRMPYAKDQDRFIFAVFLVGDNYEGDGKDEGYVEADLKYRMQMSPEEAEQLKFWDYYFNPNKPEKTVFGSGLHRYLTNIQAAQILGKICEIKRGTKEEALAQEFFEHYCMLKGLHAREIPEAEGGLRRNAR